jgi:hypothetical protein
MSILTNQDAHRLWMLGFGKQLSGIIDGDRQRGGIPPIGIPGVGSGPIISGPAEPPPPPGPKIYNLTNIPIGADLTAAIMRINLSREELLSLWNTARTAVTDNIWSGWGNNDWSIIQINLAPSSGGMLVVEIGPTADTIIRSYNNIIYAFVEEYTLPSVGYDMHITENYNIDVVSALSPSMVSILEGITVELVV